MDLASWIASDAIADGTIADGDGIQRGAIRKVSVGAVGSMGLAASGLAPSPTRLQYAHETGRTGADELLSVPGREDLGKQS